MVDRKKAVVTTPLSEKKSSTKDVEKGTDELADTLLFAPFMTCKRSEERRMPFHDM